MRRAIDMIREIDGERGTVKGRVREGLSETLPCVHSKRSRVYFQNAHVSGDTGVLEAHMGPVFSARKEQPQPRQQHAQPYHNARNTQRTQHTTHTKTDTHKHSHIQTLTHTNTHTQQTPHNTQQNNTTTQQHNTQPTTTTGSDRLRVALLCR